MAVIGFSFLKFDCERKKAASGSIEINHNINVEKVEKTSLNVGAGKSDVLKVEFKFEVVYAKGDLGTINIRGDVIFSDTPEIISETFKTWEADKKLNAVVNEEVYKFIYQKGIIKAIELSDSLNLPAPIPVMPKDLFPKTK